MAKMPYAEALAYLKKVADYLNSDPKKKQADEEDNKRSNVPPPPTREQSPEIEEVPRPDNFPETPKMRSSPPKQSKPECPLPKWRRDNERRKSSSHINGEAGSSQCKQPCTYLETLLLTCWNMQRRKRLFRSSRFQQQSWRDFRQHSETWRRKLRMVFSGISSIEFRTRWSRNALMYRQMQHWPRRKGSP